MTAARRGESASGVTADAVAARRDAVPGPLAANRLVRAFAALRAERRCALIPYIMAGDPDVPATEQLVDTLVASGASAVELGVPFSDPIADGPVNQRAGLRAMAQGMAIRPALDLVARLRTRTQVPLLIMTYYNLVLRYGPGRFAREAVSAGLDGLIAADLPPDTAEELTSEARRAGLATVFMAAPTSTLERIRAVAAASTGFVYCVSRTGVTGVRDTLPEGLPALIARIRAETEKPVCVGFGISRPAQAREVARVADGVIVGSALVQMIEDDPHDIARLERFVRDLAAAITAA
ncbi:MAG TPA: tryptophan synthase subunit alpha [bacterium]|nr:tryptophan synthase subunit alpha [bacterium]